MHPDLMLILITATIAALLLVIAVLLLASIVRRVLIDRKYRKLDDLHQDYERQLTRELGQEGRAVQEEAFRARPGTLNWQTVEHALFAVASEGTFAEQAKGLFQRLGYAAFYEKQLTRRNVLVRASAIDKLGRMRSTASTPKLLAQLDEKDPEILSVTVRALGRIGQSSCHRARGWRAREPRRHTARG